MATAAAAAAVAVAPTTGVAAPAVLPVRLGASPADTTVTRHGGALASSDPDELALPADSPVIAAFPFLQWVLPPPGGRSALVALSELQGICITACNFNLADSQLVRALRNANLMESGLSAAACSAVLHELHDVSGPVADARRPVWVRPHTSSTVSVSTGSCGVPGDCLPTRRR
ncbi:hypothetical protein AB1Y20_018388 [Prymnesium parvum]|uniref:Uncharacterized protein n=1 Tax=Prymnesium parvum TaxID=97485 RepID=A0AB34JRK5_PRYPA